MTRTDQDDAEAVRRLLFGLAAAIQDLHPPQNPFPGEVFMRLSADALDGANVGRHDPVRYEGLRERYLPECKFQGANARNLRTPVDSKFRLHRWSGP